MYCKFQSCLIFLSTHIKEFICILISIYIYVINHCVIPLSIHYVTSVLNFFSIFRAGLCLLQDFLLLLLDSVFCLSMMWLLFLSVEAVLCFPNDMLVYIFVGICICNHAKYRGKYCQVDLLPSCFQTFWSNKTFWSTFNH